jgi:predicted PurR-regulated permease PerM
MNGVFRSPVVRLVLFLAAVGLVVWFVVALRSVVTPFAVAFAFAYFLNPPVNALETLLDRMLVRFPRLAAVVHPRTIAVGVLCAVVVGVLVLAVVIAVPAGYQQVMETAQKLPGYVVTLHSKLEPALQRLEVRYPQQVALVRAEVETFLKGGELERLVKEHGLFVLTRVTKFIRDTVTNVVDVAIGAFNLFIIPIFAVYLLYDMNHIRDGAKELVPLRFRDYVYSRGRAIDRLLSAFARGQITVCLILGTFYAIALTLCGVPMGLLVGFVIGFFNLIPFMSTILGLPLAVSLSLLDDQSLPRAAAVAAVFLFGQFVEGNFITPRIVGQGLGLHAVVVMLAVLAGGSLFGFIGMLVAVPVTAALSVFWADLRTLYMQSDFYRGDPPPDVTVVP